MGRLFTRGKGEIWWIEYYHSGKQIRETARSKVKAVAQRFLKQREGEIAQGKLPGRMFDRVSFNELAAELLADYRINRRKSLVRVERSVRHLRRYVGGLKATAIDTPQIRQYIEARLSEGAANATINRELAALKRMFNLGTQCTPSKVDKVPHIPMLEEDNVRQGFFEDWELAALLEHLPEYLRGMTVFAYRTGWRVSELTNLKWSQIDRDEGYARLEVGTTKNKAGRTVVLDDVLRDVIERQWSTRIRNGILIPYVFPNRTGTDKIKDFRYVWGKACEKARIGKKYFHDFRRSAVRNLTRAGVPERLAQEITGHKTRSVFERYNIISEADLRLAAERQAAYLKEKAARASTKTRTILDFEDRKKAIQQ